MSSSDEPRTPFAPHRRSAAWITRSRVDERSALRFGGTRRILPTGRYTADRNAGNRLSVTAPIRRFGNAHAHGPATATPRALAFADPTRTRYRVVPLLWEHALRKHAPTERHVRLFGAHRPAKGPRRRKELSDAQGQRSSGCDRWSAVALPCRRYDRVRRRQGQQRHDQDPRSRDTRFEQRERAEGLQLPHQRQRVRQELVRYVEDREGP